MPTHNDTFARRIGIWIANLFRRRREPAKSAGTKRPVSSAAAPRSSQSLRPRHFHSSDLPSITLDPLTQLQVQMLFDAIDSEAAETPAADYSAFRLSDEEVSRFVQRIDEKPAACAEAPAPEATDSWRPDTSGNQSSSCDVAPSNYDSGSSTYDNSSTSSDSGGYTPD